MNWKGKIIGMIVGSLILGHVGLVIGLALGHIWDQGWLPNFIKQLFYKSSSIKKPGIFFNTIFQVMGCIAKADGRVSEAEIIQARYVMTQMNLDNQLKIEAIRLFTEGKRSSFDLRAALYRLKESCRFQPALLKVFVDLQSYVVSVDGPESRSKKERLLQKIMEELGIDREYNSSFSYHYNQQSQYQRKREYNSYQSSYTHNNRYNSLNPKNDLSADYKLLGVSKEASDREIEKAYRRLMSRYHPDRFIAKKYSEESIKIATKKTQDIRSAYKRIQQARKK